MGSEQQNIDDNYKNIILTKLAYERCERYISCARAILHIHDEELENINLAEKRAFRNLWHILDLVSVEIDALAAQLDDSVKMVEGAGFEPA